MINAFTFARFDYNGIRRTVVFVEDEEMANVPMLAYDFTKGGFRNFFPCMMENFCSVNGMIDKIDPKAPTLQSSKNVSVAYDYHRGNVYAVLKEKV